MAVIGTLKKQPREILPITVSYEAVLDGQTASAITPTFEVPVGLTLTGQAVVGSVAQALVGGGTSGIEYTITVLTDITISGNLVRVEDEIKVKVAEV